MKIIAGNWKMNGSKQALKEMTAELNKIDTDNAIILCVPFTMLGAETGKINLGAQDISNHEKGAYTGEISGAMLKEAGAKYVIVGHSERRQYHNEDNDIVRQKAEMAIQNGIIPIICVGETMEEKQAGKAMEIIESGVKESVPNNSNGHIIIAYEPRWAIGAGITPTHEEIEQAHSLIAKTLHSLELDETPILYGASVNGLNAGDIMSLNNVDGVLVGGASLKPDDFISIITSIK